MPTRDPLTQAADEAASEIRGRWDEAKSWINKWIGAQLTTLLLGGLGVGGLIWVAFPWAVALGALIVILVALVYAVYCRKQLVEERTMRRRAFITGKRVQQKALQSELTLRQVAIALVGEPGERRRLYEARTPGAKEVRQAANYVSAKARAYVASVDDSPRAQAARRRGSAPMSPKAPDVRPWIRRAEALAAEIENLEAEIQALSVPGSPALEEALTVSMQRRRAAHEADRVASDRLRAGYTPSPAAPQGPLTVSIRPDGRRDVRPDTPAPTPEQIAKAAEVEDEPT